MASARPKRLRGLDSQRARALILRGLVEEYLDEMADEALRLGHVSSVWELTLAALERRRTGGLRAVSERAGVRLSGYRAPRRLKERRAPSR